MKTLLRILPNRRSFRMLGVLLLMLTGLSLPAQIFAPEGINIPGAWNSWNNAPTNLAFAASTQTAGGRVTPITLGDDRWQTIIRVASSGGDIIAGSYGFKFSSGPTSNYWNNAWGKGSGLALNTLEPQYIGGGDNTVTVANGKWYTINWKDVGYGNTQAIVMETSAAPVNLTSSSQSPLNGSVEVTDPVIVTINSSAAPAADEYVYLRYTTTGYATSFIVPVSFAGNVGTATIPTQIQGATVSYYAFSTSILSPSSDYDMYTIKASPAAGYTVNTPLPPVNITFQIDMNQQTVGGNVYVNGNFPPANWTTPQLMSDPNSDGVYTYTVALNQGSSFEFKFINGAAYEGSLGAPCGNGSNRTYTVGNADASIPISCFGLCTTCPSLYQVTFQVNMSNETVSGNGVHIAGSFQGWDPGTTAMTSIGGGMYEYIANITAGPIQYKFVNGNSWGSDEQTIPGACNFSGNRNYTVPASSSTVGPFCFNSCSNCISTTWTSIASGNWNSASTWDANSVPPAGVNVVIANGHTVTLNVNTQVINNLTISPTAALLGSDGTPRTIFIGGGANFIKNGTFTSTAAGTVQFGGANAVNGTVSFNNVILEGGVDFNSGSTVTGVLQINAGGFVNVDAPTYAANSILRYNTTGSYGRGAEWSSTSGQGYPFHVEINNNTDVFPGANGGQNVARAIAGNLTVSSGCGFYMDWGGSVMTQAVTINGNVTVNGGLSLSTQSGGDLNVKGNFIVNSGSTFSGNSRSLNFNGTLAQSVGGTAASLNLTDGSSNNSNGVTLNLPVNVSNTFRAISGTLVSNGNLRLNSGGTLLHGVGTPLGGGAVSGNIIARRQGSIGNEFNFWSSPVSGVSTNILAAQSYSYDPNTGTLSTADDNNEPGWISATGPMNVGQGYASLGSGTISFTGPANNAGLTYAVAAPVAPASNSNLIGNPYPSAITANAFLSANGPSGTNVIGGALYFWDDDGTVGLGYSATDYAVWNGAGSVGGGGNTPNGNIASGQGFFVIANSSGNVSFSNSMRNDNNSSFFDEQPIQRVRLSITNGNNHYNETLIAFLDDATAGEDPLYDAPKMRGNANLAFYSKIANEEMAIQGLPVLTNDRIVQMGLFSTFAGTHTIRLNELENIPSSVMVYLEDREKNIIINLRIQDTYTFLPGVNLNNRFSIRFTAPVDVAAVSESCAGNDGKITLTTLSSTAKSVDVANSDGVNVYSNPLQAGNLELNNLQPGAYFVTLGFNDNYTTTIPVEITAAETISISIQAEESAMVNETVVFEANGNDNISWNMGDGTILFGNPVSYSYEVAGVYSVTAGTSNESCNTVITQSISILADNSTGIFGMNNDGFSVYPNPSNGQIIISGNAFTAGKYSLTLSDISGRIISADTRTIQPGQPVDYSFGDIADGVYQLNITGNDVSSTQKIIIRK